jgi:hypothetical protein
MKIDLGRCRIRDRSFDVHVGQIGNLPPMIIGLLLWKVIGKADLTIGGRMPSCPTSETGIC